jgi:uncharacterized protein YggU (UPF0235/DUF167 family)
LPVERARIPVRITPRGNRDTLDTWQDGALCARVAAPPIDGRANDALLRLLAKALNAPISSLRIVQGEHSRRKVIEVAGMSQVEVDERLSRYAN